MVAGVSIVDSLLIDVLCLGPSWTLDITAPDIFMENYWETERRFSFGRWAQPFNGGFYG